MAKDREASQLAAVSAANSTHPVGYLLNFVNSTTIAMMSSITAKMPSIPFHMMESEANRAILSMFFPPYLSSCGTKLRIMPPARTDAI